MKRKLLLATILLVVGLAVWLVQTEHRFRQATYQGQHADFWAAQLFGNFDPLGTNEAIRAFQTMGPEAVPALRRLLARHESGLEKLFVANARQLPMKLRLYLFERVKPGQSVVGRVGAARALGIIGPQASVAIPDLLSALRAEPGNVRWAAAQALAAIGPESIPSLMTLATNQDSDLRHAAIYSLGQAGSNALPATALLLRCGLETNEAVRSSAFYALSRIGPPALPVLLEEITGPDPARGDVATRALLAIQPPVGRVPTLLYNYSGSNAPALRRQAIEVMMRLRLANTNAMKIYQRALEDGDESVRLAAVRAIQRVELLRAKTVTN